jgi:anti-sigma factor RsiW
MKNTEAVKIDCRTCRKHLADLLLDDAYAAERPEFAAHMQGCEDCTAELAELRATFAVLDSWTAPEPTPYFDAKMHVLLREEQAAAPEGFWARLRSTMMFSTGRALRPVMAGALAVIMLAGGGGVLIGVHPWGSPEAASPTVNDLRILDRNAQALQQMDQLLEEPAGPDDGTAQPTT